jgi:hypothetical protein
MKITNATLTELKESRKKNADCAQTIYNWNHKTKDSMKDKSNKELEKTLDEIPSQKEDRDENKIHSNINFN